jgi:hypothetical protein
MPITQIVAGTLDLDSATTTDPMAELKQRCVENGMPTVVRVESVPVIGHFVDPVRFSSWTIRVDFGGLN